MKRRFKGLSFILVLCLLLTAFLVGCGSNTPTDTGSNNGEAGEVGEVDDDFKLVLRLSHVFSPEEQLTKSMDWVAERIYERTDGAIEIQTFPQGQIAAYKDGVEQVVRGADFISVEDPSYIGDYVPDFTALVGPMLYNSYDEYVEMVRTELVEDMKKKAEEKGIKILALDYIFGFRNVITDKVIETPDDLRGIKLRTPGSQLFIETLTAMGATVTPLPWGETISAMQQGVVDGIEGSEFTNIGNKIYEIKKNVAFTQHFLGTCGVYISTEVWDRIPERYQVIIAEEFEKGAAEMVEIGKTEHSQVVAELESYGVQFNEVDKEAFVEATRSIYDTFPGLTPGIYDRLQEELAIIREKL
ncbi:C4-dicarboxylate TRAP transporter substrate-binding protein [Natronincola ferrireducens]|uniref:TRAP-type C4-dicarboxylate transport system, substrate-binding protein n=1 Tax=Natronincola ferrireducens TaxID=393762 RepID=A0A1G8YHC8_9FIRM|nr:C4-dicarboxylate TRAP transporter substrate-binding protein [Natronincola ferrireducens]SDK01804.1 TRAP-type C4-dicarboxylate transport system, substrate-binding protein [Natronincola ferrireducens]